MNYDQLINPVVKSIPPSGIRKFFDIAAEMKDCISLGVGEPDFVTPWNIREAGINSLKNGLTCYTSNAGLPELRQLICRYYRERSAPAKGSILLCGRRYVLAMKC